MIGRNPYGAWFQSTSCEFSIYAGMKCIQRVIPPFQRPLVWTETQCRLFIESIWAGLPIGSWCYNEHQVNTSDGIGEFDGWLLDGQQRWHAIELYMSGDLVVHGDRFTDIEPQFKRRFTNTTFPALRTRIETAEGCKEVYMRLAYGGTPHEVVT